MLPGQAHAFVNHHRRKTKRRIFNHRNRGTPKCGMLQTVQQVRQVRMNFGSVLKRTALLLLGCFAIAALSSSAARAQASLPAQVEIDSGWQLQDAAKVPWRAASPRRLRRHRLVRRHRPRHGAHHAGKTTSTPSPSTAKTTASSPKAWCTPRTGIAPPSPFPASYEDRHVWLNFDGINYSAEVWVNGTQVGTIAGAFIRGNFDITARRQARQDGRGRCARLRRSRIPAFRTSTPFATASARTAASPPSTGPPSSPPSAGTGCLPSATATPASGRRSISPPPAQCC